MEDERFAQAFTLASAYSGLALAVFLMTGAVTMTSANTIAFFAQGASAQAATAVLAAPIVTPVPRAQVAAVATCSIGRVLSLGMSGSDVLCLQKTLAQDPSVYPEGMVTGYFGALTQKAVQRWQVAHGTASNASASAQAPASGQTSSVHSTLSPLQQLQVHIAQLSKEDPSLTTPISVPRYVLPTQKMTGASMYSGVPLNVSINTCQEITTPGHYTAGSDIVQSASSTQPCISVHDTSDIVLDCAAYSIAGAYAAPPTIFAQNVTNLTVKNCSVLASEFGFALYLQNITNGHINNNNVGGYIVQIYNSSGLDVSGNTFTSVYQQAYTSNSTITNNNFSRLDNRLIAGQIISVYGSGNQIIGNVLDGNAKGDFNIEEGADDGIIVEDEHNDLIRGNTIKNDWDCGIETLGMFADSRIENNSVTNTGYCGIGAWYWSSWKGNTVSNNTTDRVVNIFNFFTFFGLRPQGYDEQRIMPADTAIYFKDNTFTGNTTTNPKGSGASIYITLPTTLSAVPGETLPTSSQLITGNNVFTNNNFGTEYGSILYPSSMFVDGGDNICRAHLVSDQTTAPIGCNFTPDPTLSLTATPSSIILGQSSTLSWSSTDANSCVSTGAPISGTIGLRGSAVVSPVSTATYTISCSSSPGLSVTQSVTVVVKIPEINYTLDANPSSGTAPLAVQFGIKGLNQSGTSTEYKIYFGDNSAPQSIPSSIIGGDVEMHTYTQSGTFTARLNKVTGPSSETEVATVVTKVTSGTTQQPLITSISPASGQSGTQVSINGSGLNSSGPVVFFGNVAVQNFDSISPSRIILAVPTLPAGSYNVVVTNAGGMSNTFSFTVTSTTPPAPIFTASPTSGTAPLAITFTSNSNGTVDFGDGATGKIEGVCTNSYPTPSCSYSTTHTYTNTTADAYTAKLLNSNKCITAGCNVVGTVTITVSDGTNLYDMSQAFSNEFLPAWPAANAIDGNAATSYSSNISGATNDRNVFLAAWLIGGPKQVNRVILTARMLGPAVEAFPPTYHVSVTAPDNSSWVDLGVFSTQPDQTGKAVVMLSQTYSTYGVLITPVMLGVDDYNNHYFQMAEVKLGLASTGVAQTPPTATLAQSLGNRPDYSGMAAAAVMAPLRLLVDSLTSIFVALGIGQ